MRRRLRPASSLFPARLFRDLYALELRTRTRTGAETSEHLKLLQPVRRGLCCSSPSTRGAAFHRLDLCCGLWRGESNRHGGRRAAGDACEVVAAAAARRTSAHHLPQPPLLATALRAMGATGLIPRAHTCPQLAGGGSSPKAGKGGGLPSWRSPPRAAPAAASSSTRSGRWALLAACAAFFLYTLCLLGAPALFAASGASRGPPPSGAADLPALARRAALLEQPAAAGDGGLWSLVEAPGPTQTPQPARVEYRDAGEAGEQRGRAARALLVDPPHAPNSTLLALPYPRQCGLAAGCAQQLGLERAQHLLPRRAAPAAALLPLGWHAMPCRASLCLHQHLCCSRSACPARSPAADHPAPGRARRPQRAAAAGAAGSSSGGRRRSAELPGPVPRRAHPAVHRHRIALLHGRGGCKEWASEQACLIRSPWPVQNLSPSFNSPLTGPGQARCHPPHLAGAHQAAPARRACTLHPGAGAAGVSGCLAEGLAGCSRILHASHAGHLPAPPRLLPSRAHPLQPSNEAELQTALQLLRSEVQQHADIIIVPGTDTYRNLPSKTLQLLRYALSSSCAYTCAGKAGWATTASRGGQQTHTRLPLVLPHTLLPLSPAAAACRHVMKADDDTYLRPQVCAGGQRGAAAPAGPRSCQPASLPACPA